MATRWRRGWGLTWVLVLGCASSPGPASDPDADGHDGGDADADTDADGGADADADSDADGDGDGGSETDDCVDADGDGFADEACGGSDCNDDDARIHPGAVSRWSGELVADPREVVGGGDPDVAVDANGVAHVCFHHRWLAGGEYVGGTYYSTDAGGTWEAEEIAAGIDVEHECAIAVTREGMPYFAYTDVLPSEEGGWASYQMNLLRRTEDGWEQVHQFPRAGMRGSDLAVDADGHVHLVFSSDDFPTYASNATGEWVTERIEDVYAARPDLALVPDGRVLAAYWTGGFQLRIATRVDGAWSARTADPEENVATEVSLSATAGAVPHMAYSVSAPLDEFPWELEIRHTWEDEDGFVPQEVLANDASAGWAALDVGPDDATHFVYSYNLTPRILYYGTGDPIPAEWERIAKNTLGPAIAVGEGGDVVACWQEVFVGFCGPIKCGRPQGAADPDIDWDC